MEVTKVAKDPINYVHSPHWSHFERRSYPVLPSLLPGSVKIGGAG